MTTNRLTAERPFAAYCVLAMDGRELYAGDSIDKARRAWVPGTTYGTGDTLEEAREWADASRLDLLAKGYRLPPAGNGRAGA